LVTALLTLSALSACSPLQTGQASAVIDASRPYVAPCAGALAGEAMPTAREACLPLLVILDGA
jgi:hypothetical protein